MKMHNCIWPDCGHDTNQSNPDPRCNGAHCPSQKRTGITSRQMMNSPKGATYVWCNGDLRYPTLLARHLGRTDLKIIGPGSVRHLEGARTYIVTDHACVLSWQYQQLISGINFVVEKEAGK